MNKSVLIIVLLASVMVFVRCRKPVFPNFKEEGYQEITFSVGGDDKGSFEITDYNTAIYKWTTDDKLYVYGIKNDGAGVGFAGILNEITLYEGSHKAKFHGYVTIPAGSEKLRFVHYGSGVTINSDYSAISDFSSQYGMLKGDGESENDNSISSKVIAYTDLPVNTTNGVYTCNRNLDLQFAIMRLKLNGFKEQIDVSGMNYNRITINSNGSVTKDLIGGSSKLNAVPSNDYFAAFVIQDDPATITLSDGSFVSEFSLDKIQNSYYYGDGGNAVEMLPLGSLAGKFSVSDTKQVRFSKGNMWHDDSGFHFENDQCDCRLSLGTQYPEGDHFCNDWVPDHVCHFFWQPYNRIGKTYAESNDESGSATEILFTNNQDVGHPDEANPDFTVNGVKGVYRALSQSEWDYLINRRSNAGSLKSVSEVTYNGTGDKVMGLIIMPDGWSGTLDAEMDYEKWKDFEAAGAVFLPAISYRAVDKKIHSYGNLGHYCSSSAYGDDGLYDLAFSISGINASDNVGREYGCAVRLVTDVIQLSDGNCNAESFDSGNW